MEDKYKKITGIQVIVIFEDGDYVTERIGIENEFVSDLHANIMVHNNVSGVINAINYLLNLGSKAITGINPKSYETGIINHFGYTRNINVWKQIYPKDRELDYIKSM